MAQGVFAEGCFKDPIYDRDWNAEVTTGAFVRDVECMEGSVVLTTLPVGTVVHVIAETDGWYKIETSDGIVGWVGQWLIAQTSKPFYEDIVEVQEPESCDEPLCDVVDHKNEDAIRYLYMEGIINGYPDGSFKPEATVNRAELLKILIEGTQNPDASEEMKPWGFYSEDNCFKDVPAGEWYTQYVCYAKDLEWIEGYKDGTFKPAQTVNKVEALKMLLNTQGVELSGSTTTRFEDVPPTAWFAKYVITASELGLLEETGAYYYPDAGMRRGSISENLYRLLTSE